MKTNQIMKREFIVAINDVYNKATVRQRTKDSYFCATDLIHSYNLVTGKRKDIAAFLALKSTSEFQDIIISKGDTRILVSKDNQEVAKKAIEVTKGGRAQGTWMHPYMFIDFAMWLSPEFKYNTIKWVYDNLIKYRIESGDNYSLMSSALNRRYNEMFGKDAPQSFYQLEAKRIKHLVGIPEDADWNICSEEQLALRNELELANIISFEMGHSFEQRRDNLLFTKRMFEQKKRQAI
jgi:hypothetical protein